MSEADRQPDIHELTDLAYRVASSDGLSVTPDEIAQALVVRAFGGIEGTRERIGKQVTWTPEQYAKAGRVAELMKRALGGEAIAQAYTPEMTNAETPPNSTAISARRRSVPAEAVSVLPEPHRERDRDMNWRKLVRHMDHAFDMDPGSTDAWLRGEDRSVFNRIQSVFREAVGITASNSTGLLMVSSEIGGVGLSMQQAKALGVGLGYMLIEENGQVIRRDVENSSSFDQHIRSLRTHGMDPSKFNARYFAALHKLGSFREQRDKAHKST